MEKVNIYITANPRSTSISMKKVGFVLECEIKGELHTKEEFWEVEATYHRAQLIAITKALGRMVRSCEVHIHSEDTYLLNMIKYRLTTWAKNGFVSGKGKPIFQKEDWKNLWEKLREHQYFVVPGRHSYSTWMEEKMKGE